MSLSTWGVWLAGTTLLLLVFQINCDVIVETAETRRPFRIYEDQPARFGDALPSDGLVGLVVRAKPVHACAPIAPPPNISLSEDVFFIALIERSVPGSGNGSECTFQEKVERAQAAKYSGVIVYNYKDDELIPMGGDADVLIPSVFVGLTDGEKLITHFSFPNLGFVVRITENTVFDINSYLLPFAIVVGVCFIIMLGIMIFKCVQDRRREQRHRLPKSSLKKIPTKKFCAGDEVHYETCCICLDDYEIGDKLRVLPCDHAYHMKCIDPWLLKNKRVCPQCRKKVFATGEVPPSDSESETEDERAPLLARPRHAPPSGTFSMQNENPFRRAARRLARSGQTSPLTRSRSDSPGGHSAGSSSTEGGDVTRDNQLIAEVHVEQPRMSSSPAPVLSLVVEEEWMNPETEDEEEDNQALLIDDEALPNGEQAPYVNDPVPMIANEAHDVEANVPRTEDPVV